jgi:hypothetical protein
LDLSTVAAEDPAAAQKLWDELAAERKTDDEPTAVKPPEENQDDAGTNDFPVNVQAQDDASTTGAEDPAAVAAAAAAAAASAPADAKPDPIAALTEKIGRLEGQLRNVNGHIGGLSEGQKQLKATMEAARANVKDAPTKEQVAEAMADPAEWTALREDFPEFVKATESLLAAKLAGLQTPGIDQGAIDKIVEARVAKEAAAIRTESIDSHLDAVVDGGNWRETVNTPAFDAWIKAQPADVQALGDSARLTDSARMLRLFEKSKVEPEAPTQTQQIADARKAKLDGATTVKSGLKGVRTAKSPDDMSPQELWNHEAAERDRKRERARG